MDPDEVVARLCGFVGARGIALPPPGVVDCRDESVLRDELLRAVGGLRAGAINLSGGLDSGTLLALAARRGLPIRAFTLAGDVDDSDGELERSRRLAAHCGVAHEVIAIDDATLPDHFADAVRAAGALIINGRGVASLLYYRALAAAGVTHALSGVGADEALAGDPGALSVDEGGVPAFWRRLTAEWSVAAEALPAGTRVAAYPGGCPQRVLLTTSLPELALPIDANTGASCGVEVGFPYLAPPVLNLALRLPARLRVRDGLGKALLRDAVRGLIPDDIARRPKSPRWAPPGGQSRRARSRWQALYDDLLAAPRLAALSIVSSRWTDEGRAALAHADGDDPRRAILDRVLMKIASLVVLAEV